MRKVTMLLAAIGFGLPIAISFPAQALSDRTWVSGLGTDSAPCSRAAPCATFQFAHDQTNPRGEINCVDAGSYGVGVVGITKSITISCEAGTAGIMVAGGGGTGIFINAAATDVVTLRGLDIDGLGVGGTGISITTAKEVHVEKCIIRNFRSVPGAAALRTASGSTSTIFMFVVDTVISDNSNGISLASAGGFKVATVKNAIITESTGNGVELVNSNAYANVTESIISGNGGSAVLVSASGSTANIDRTTMANNATALNASASGATIRSIGNNVFNNTTAVSIAAGAIVATDGQNRSGGNTNTQAPNASVTLF
jgi:hypothetical protein